MGVRYVLLAASASTIAVGGPCAPFDPFDKPYPWSTDVPLTVAADGSGNCTTIQGAIDLLNGSKAAYGTRFVFHILPGVYREKVRVSPLTPPLTLRGLGSRPEDVLVVWDDAEFPSGPEGCRSDAGGEWDSQTLQVAADDFTASDMSVWNSACHNKKGRNLAVSVTSDRAAFFRVRILGGQDTFYTGFKRVYVRDSFVKGYVDFIFGIGSAVFENSEIQETKGNGFLTAHKGNNVSQVDGAKAACDLGWGASCEAYVFSSCRLTSALPSPTGRTYLGRPWRDWATVVYLNTWMGPHIAKTGWDPWGTGCKSSDERCASVFYGELGSRGPGAGASKRVAWSRQLTAKDAERYSTAKVLRGWRPVDPVASTLIVV